MEVKLVIVGGKTNKRDVKLKLPSVIGRSREADLTIAHPMISRRHCELFEADGFIKIKDLGSLNGTYVQGRRIEEEVLLPPNAEFTVGPLTFRIEYEAPQISPEAPPLGDHETPEYIPAQFAGQPEPATVSPKSVPPELPTSEPVFSETSGVSETLPEETPPWEDLASLEEELSFDLAEEEQIDPEKQAQAHAGPADSEASEEIASEEGAAEPAIPFEFSEEEALPELENLSEADDSQEQAPPPSESPLEEVPPPQPEAEEKEAARTETPSVPEPESSSESSEEDKPLEEGLDEVEDAALRDFLKGLR